MSQLTDGLNRIYNKMAIHTPHRIQALEPGISVSQIKDLVTDIPFKLPSEVYELYQWHNGLFGWDFLFENYEFLSLERAAYKYREELEQVKADHPEIAKFFQYRFPLFENSSECGVFITIASNENQDSSVYEYDISFEDFALRYHNLTDLILHSAEWYETAIFDEDGSGYWNIEKAGNEIQYWLDTKYMVRERIVKTVNGQGGGLQQLIYQRFLEQ